MNDHYRAGQGTVIPSLFIGIGGAGSRIVDRIAGRAARLPNWNSQLQPLTHFISIDTNTLDQHRLEHVPAGNRLNIADFDKVRVIENFRRSRDRQALQWLDQGYQPRPGFKPGAGQIRVESRLGFFYHSPEIRQRLRELVDSMLRPGITWRQSSPPSVNAYVFCTLAGGTGSGSFLSLAYLVESVIRQQSWHPRVVGYFLLSTLMQGKVGPELHADIHANTYAALKELEYLTKLDYPRVRQEGRLDEVFVYCRDPNGKDISRVAGRPFFLSFLFDRPPHLGLTEPEATIADAAFLQLFTPLIGNLAGELDNYEKNLTELTRFPGSLRDVGQGYTKNFAAFGAAALVLPGEDLLEYCALRFAAEAVRQQITFGVDATAPADDRVLALARLAVDYRDPKFLRMADEGRESVINRAFIASVQELARQDAAAEQTDGYWYRLVESVETGRLTGVDPDGREIRNESLTLRVERKLAEARATALNKVSIKERAFNFWREGLNQYVELVSRLRDDIRAAANMVGESLPGLELAAREGEPILDLKLDPLTERYLVIRLLENCEQKWLPEAQQLLDKTAHRDINNPKIRERLELELPESLRTAAQQRPWRKPDQPFLDARDEAQRFYVEVAAGARKVLDASLRLRQLRALLQFLQRRSRQYAGLATRMDGLVQELEQAAERLRRGESAVVPPLTLRVEVFETLDEPRIRLWDRVYRTLFLDDGRHLSTFDRQLLAETVARELRPTLRADGRVVDKSLDECVADLRRSLCELGRRQLRPAVLGDATTPGLDIPRGLDLEARLVEGPELADGEIAAYRDKKFRALEQLAGLLARVDSAGGSTLDDGVRPNRTRQVIFGGRPDAPAARQFQERLSEVLRTDGRQVQADSWHNPHQIVVHDVELPIPLYYFPAIVGDIEAAYDQLAAEERRSYHLHTDFHWEKSLPNLNPRRSELTMGWSLATLASGLALGVITEAAADGEFYWQVDDQGGMDHLGSGLSAALYQLGEIHRNDDLRRDLEGRLSRLRAGLAEDAERSRRESLAEALTARLNRINRGELKGEMSQEQSLDRPILRALIQSLRQPAVSDRSRPRSDRD